jgi:large subunit ribosomal protein L31
MQKDIHPNYRPVVFLDTAGNFSFLTRSTVKSNETIKWTDGKEYPLVKLDISSASHPFFTGKMKFIDTTGRVEKFQRKYNWDKRKKAEDKTEEKKES